MSTIKIYKACKIDRYKNFVIEDIQTYLSALTNIPILDFQRLKLNLNLSIKINASQSLLTPQDFTDNINYLEVEQDSFKYYYFVTGYKWIAEECIQLDLLMDTLNTYSVDNGLVLGEKTKIIRQHKNRFKDVAISGITEEQYQNSGGFQPATSIFQLENAVNATITDIEVVFTSVNTCQVVGKSFIASTGRIQVVTNNNTGSSVTFYVTYKRHKTIRDIDLNSEGISPILYRNPAKDKELREKLDIDTYLIYKNRDAISPTDYNQVNPVDVYVTYDKDIRIESVDASSGTIQYSDLVTGRYYYLTHDLNGNTPLYIGGTKRDNFIDKHQSGLNTYEYFTIMYRSGSTITLERWERSTGLQNVTLLKDTISGIASFEVKNKHELHYYYDTIKTHALNTIKSMSKSYFTLSAITYKTMNTINDVDRTDSKLIKIIKLPYNLVELKDLGSNLYQIMSSGWTYDTATKMLKLDDINDKFTRELAITLNPLEPIMYEADMSDKHSIRNDTNESKLLHSDFYYSKFVYDSFGFVYQLEKVQADENILEEKFRVNYDVTSTINSRFMFTFIDYPLLYADSDFENILVVSRNNEVTLYNSSYINYIRNGYNYDVKSKNRQVGASWLMTGLSAAGAVASFALSGATGGASAIAGVGLLTSTIGGLASSINTTLSSEQNLQQKLQQAQNQAVSVSGADDVDLMSVYSLNRAKMVTYELSPKMKKLIGDLFYYCGYACDYMDTPNISSRYWFNFLQADIVIEDKKQFSEEVIEQIISLYATGVTFLHQHSGEYDFAQVYENWEVNL